MSLATGIWLSTIVFGTLLVAGAGMLAAPGAIAAYALSCVAAEVL